MDHSLCPGIIAGDIGPKAGGGNAFVLKCSSLMVDCFPGSAALDNGFARFHHVRIPRKNMFSRFAMVTNDGRYIKPQNPKHSFGGVCPTCFKLVHTLNHPTDDAYPCEVVRSTVVDSSSNGCP